MKESTFFALASDSSTDRAANKQELVYTRTVSMGKSRTAFLGLHDLQDGSAEGILAAYKQVMLHAGLTVEEWISRVFCYCVDGAVVMQSTENGIARLLMQLQRDVQGHSVIVPTIARAANAAHRLWPSDEYCSGEISCVHDIQRRFRRRVGALLYHVTTRFIALPTTSRNSWELSIALRKARSALWQFV